MTTTGLPDSTPAISDLIGYAREHAAWLRRQQITLVETGRLSLSEAQRRQRLADRVVAALEVYAASNGTVIERIAPPPESRNGCTVTVRCAGVQLSETLLDARRVLTDTHVRADWSMRVRSLMMTTLKAGFGS